MSGLSFCALATSPLQPCATRSEEHTSELQSLRHLVCRLLLEKKKKQDTLHHRDKLLAMNADKCHGQPEGDETDNHMNHVHNITTQHRYTVHLRSAISTSVAC